jgi:solute:Na+ symporter, SSS family
MALSWIDWVIVVGYLVFALGLGAYLSRRASGSITDYFLAGRKLPWWLAGTSVVATSFGADTPLAVSGFVRSEGIYANWFWWSAAMGAMLMVAFYARLWRRSRLVTDLEFIEHRYHGRPAQALRIFSTFYFGIVANCIVLGWMMLAMSKVAVVAFGWPEVFDLSLGGNRYQVPGELVLLAVLVIATLSYTMLSGLWGVVATDLLQFGIAMVGALVLMGMVYLDVGGPSGLMEKLHALPDFDPKTVFFMPDLAHAGGLVVFTFAVYLSVQWWASAAGASNTNQRMLSMRNERDATYGMFWGQFAHYTLRTWPWVVVGLASFIYFPPGTLADPELAYPKMMFHFLPTGLRGLMMVAFIAAFMSTMDTRLNWGASYLVNDFYKRFLRPEASQAHYLVISRLSTMVIVVLAAVTAWQMETIAGAWKYLAQLGSGVGLVVLLRWFWWRVNAWSEISALVTSAVMTNVVKFLPVVGGHFASELVTIVAVSTVVWLTVTFLTRPTEVVTLERFYRRIRPGGWWGPIAERCPEVEVDRASRGWPIWIAGTVVIYASMFGIGHLCLARWGMGTLFLFISVLAAWYFFRCVHRMPEHSGDEKEWETVEEAR